MAISIVQSQYVNSTSGSGTSSSPTKYTLAFSSAITAGNAIVLIEATTLYGGTPTVSSVPTDSKSNTYHTVFSTTSSQSAVNAQTILSMYYAYNVAAGTTTITSNASVYNYCCCCTEVYSQYSTELIALEVSGLGSTNPLDVYASKGALASSNSTSGNITTTSANELLVGCVDVMSNGANAVSYPSGWTTTSGFTLLTANRNGGYGIPAVEYEIVSSTGTFSSNMKATPGGGGSAAYYIKGIAGFKQGAAAQNKSNFMVFF